jgi:hypothetical protein
MQTIACAKVFDGLCGRNARIEQQAAMIGPWPTT